MKCKNGKLIGVPTEQELICGKEAWVRKQNRQNPEKNIPQ